MMKTPLLLLKSTEVAIEEEKVELGQIKCKIVAFNVIMIVLNVIFCLTAPANTGRNLFTFYIIQIILLMNVSVLAYSVTVFEV